MSGFSAAWLALREPADHAARETRLLARLARHFGSRGVVHVTDLGCGTGSNLRAVARHLPGQQVWRLVDHDPALLAAAAETLAGWADRVEERGSDRLRLLKGDRRLEVRLTSADLSADVEDVLGDRPDLVTAAALFDLVSAAWADRLVEAVRRAGSVVYAALSYDGTETWEPAHPLDEAVLAAFVVHQGGDKGFGPALGPQATGYFLRALAGRGYEVERAVSPWRLGPADAALIAELAAGSAAAAAETGLVPAEDLAAWLDARRRASRVLIGHQDLLGLP